ncbi:MAG: VOC family protein [Planctomycetales bacterium]|nr:VOC family protein [Planctomycetales bacterium]
MAVEAWRSQVDHLVYGTPSLDLTVDALEQTLGVHAAPGGQHLNWGTRNALIRLGARTYLEIIGPDEQQPNFSQPRVFGVDRLDGPRLVTWAACSTALDSFVVRARQQGWQLGDVQEGSRQRTDGKRLSWRLTDPYCVCCDGLQPFFIDWGESDHPALAASAGCGLRQFRAEHPRADEIQATLTGLGVALPVSKGPRPLLIATIETPRGLVELT